MSESDGTEEKILEAARRVFLRHGTAGARMQQIADEADVNKALLHYYFDDKATLSRAVFRRAARELFPRVLDVLRSDAAIEEKVGRVVRLELQHLSQHPFLPGYILTEIHSQPGRARELITSLAGEPARRFVPEVLETLQRQLDERAREGTLRPIEARQFVVSLISLCIFPFAAAPMLKALFGFDDREFRDFIGRREEILPDLFLRGLAPAPDGGTP